MFRNASHNAMRGFTESISLLRGPQNLIKKEIKNMDIILKSQCGIAKETGEGD